MDYVNGSISNALDRIKVKICQNNADESLSITR